MFMQTQLVINGDPVGKQRIRASFKQKRLYTPDKTIDYENYVKYCYHGHPHFEDKPVAVYMKVYLAIPSSTSKKKREQMENQEIYPVKKPDIDNVVKSVLDGLNKVAYEDDKQVVRLMVEKYYDSKPRVEIQIVEAKVKRLLFKRLWGLIFSKKWWEV
jgi:Holliday junction resolvase RusA-like endonuclease